MTKETVSFMEKLAKKGPKQKKMKEAKQTEDGIVRCLAKNGLMNKDTDLVKAAEENRRQRTGKRRARFSSSSFDSHSSSSSTESSSDSDDSSSDGRRINRRKRSLEKTTTKPKRACRIWLQSFVS